jgi:GT2 family glycosyltransferase
MNPTKIAVVIIHWNNRHLLTQFLPSLVNHIPANATIYLADNASTDDSITYTKQYFPNIKIIALDKNYGYAKGYNEALKHIDADYFVLLNNDVEVRPKWIERVVSEMEKDPAIAAAQPKLLQYKNPTTFEYAGAAGGYIDQLGYVFCKGRLFEQAEVDMGQYQQTSTIFWASGACMFIKSVDFFEAGGFDDDFFAHMEEVDLCWRLQLLGKKIIVVPQAEVLHLGGSTLQKASPQKTYLNFRNSLIMLLKNLPSNQLWWFIPFRSLLDLISSVFFIVNGEFKHSWAIHRAHAHFFFRLGYWFKKRHSVKRINHLTKNPNVYPGSIVFEHFIKKRNTYRALKHWQSKNV